MSVSHDKFWHNDSRLERHLASATLFYSHIVFAQNKTVVILIQFLVNFQIAVPIFLAVHTFDTFVTIADVNSTDNVNSMAVMTDEET